jgi:hypothetical protein
VTCRVRGDVGNFEIIAHDVAGNDLTLGFEAGSLHVVQSDGTTISDVSGTNPIANFYTFGIWYEVSFTIEDREVTVYRTTVNPSFDPNEYHFRLNDAITMNGLELRTADNNRSDAFAVDFCLTRRMP